MSMKIIVNDKENEIIIKKSKFTGIIKRIQSEEEVNEILLDTKKKYQLASHIPYAYILDNKKKYSDDKEPSNTAGLPILNVLEKNNLNYCLAIVVRYFGGIKLGSSNLLRAYQNTIIELLQNNIKELSFATKIKLSVNYDELNNLKYLLGDAKITKEDYQEKITLEIIINDDDLYKLNNYSYEIIKKSIIN